MRSLSLAFLAILCVGAFAQQELFDYVATPDPNYTWVDTGIVINSSSTGTPAWVGYVLNMTSQGWLTAADTNRPIWYHTVVVVVPTELEITDHAFMYITGNHNGYVPNKKDGDLKLVTTMAVATKSLAAVLYQVPNEPIVFAEDPEQVQRTEDAMVAFTWKMYMEHPDRPEWVSYLPMVKSAVRAMDTVTAYCKEKQLGNVQEFVVGGGSKRGWTTWLTGAVDKRVVGIVPIVMDMLNFVPNVMHMYEAYGGWTFVFADYFNLNITGAFGTPAFDAVANIVDPLVYKKYLTMPKLVVDATGDEFFMPDDDWFWWGQLPGETYRLMVPNAEHSMATGVGTAVPAVEAFYLSIATGATRPVLNWTIAANGTIFAQTNTQPTLVIMHVATTFDAVRRDFRLVKGDTPSDPCHFIGKDGACLNPVLWFGETVAPTSIVDGVYSYAASQPLPDSGWRGFLLQFIFPGPQGSTYHFTTQVSIVPNTFPFSACEIGVNCQGVLV